MQQNLTRREALKRGAMTAGALAWATPVMQVVGISPAYAQEPSPGDDVNCCIDDDGNTIKLKSLTMEYLGVAENSCDGDFTQDPSLVSCTYFKTPLEGEPVWIVSSNQEFPFQSDGIPKPAARIWYNDEVSALSTFDIDASNDLESRLKGETWVHIFESNPAGDTDFEELYLQKVGFHTSCSEPLFTGDRFGSVRVVGCEHQKPEEVLVEPEAEVQELEEGAELQEGEELEEGAELQEGEELEEGQGTEEIQEAEEAEPVEGSEEGEESNKPEKPEQSQGNGPPGSNESSDDPVTTTSAAESDGSTDSTDESGTEETSG